MYLRKGVVIEIHKKFFFMPREWRICQVINFSPPKDLCHWCFSLAYIGVNCVQPKDLLMTLKKWKVPFLRFVMEEGFLQWFGDALGKKKPTNFENIAIVKNKANHCYSIELLRFLILPQSKLSNNFSSTQIN